MKIALLSAGTGSYFCGTCMRDNALVQGLRRLGDVAELVPLYLPLQLDEESGGACPVFLGGINSYLQYRFSFFRHTPRWLDALFDRPAALRAAGRQAGFTDPASLADMTIDMLRGPAGRQRKEIARLCRWLGVQGPWDAIILSNGLLAGLQPALADIAPVVVTLQGEDCFVDAMPAAERAGIYALMAHHCRAAAGVVAVSSDYARRMEALLGLGDIAVCDNGIDLDGWSAAAQPPSPPSIGFFAHIAPGKGLHHVVDGFIELGPRRPQLRLRIGGSCSGADRVYLERQLARLREAGLAERVAVHCDVDRAGKIAFMRDCSILTVMPDYEESFGLYLLEAVAAGAVPVMPRRGALPGIIGELGCGRVAEEGALVAAWEAVLDDLTAQRQRVLDARPMLEQAYGSAAMAERMQALLQRMIGGQP